MKNYLLFGDSNTWGYRPATDGERFPFGRLFENAAEKSKCFPQTYKEVTDKQGVHFLDASKLAAPPACGDGVHIDETGAAAIGNAIADFIQAKLRDF
jgi:lysophospholipase L1-like esterase